jgi:hypothetical protein
LVRRNEVFDVDERVLAAILLEELQCLLNQVAEICPEGEK